MAYKKCLLCGNEILPTEQFTPYKNRFVHQTCFDEYAKGLADRKKESLAKAAETRRKKPKVKLTKEGVSEDDYVLKKQYYDYLRSLLDDELLTIKQFAVSEKYIEKYNFTFEGMYQTLKYLNEIKCKELKGDIVGIIPYYYTEAEEFNQDLARIEKENKGINWNKLYPQKVIKINPKRRGTKQLDIESVGEE